MNPTAVKVLLLDDHAMFRHGLRRLLEEQPDIRAVAEAATGRAALEQLQSFAPDIVVVDIHLSGENGIDFARQILAAQPSTRIIVLSANSSLNLIHNALQAGVLGYVTKMNAAEELLRAIHSVLDHCIYLSPDVASAVATGYLKLQEGNIVPASKLLLTERERCLLKLIAEGRRNKEIAEELGIALKSAETFRSRLMKKLGCANTNELIRYALREGIASL